MKWYHHIISQARLAYLYRSIIPFTRIIKMLPSLWLHGHARFPLTINFLITNRCNLSCHMCSYYSDNNSRKAESDEISVSEFKSIIKDAKTFSPVICLSGGEPGMREDLIDLIRIVKHDRMKCLIITNGLLFQKNRMDEVLDSGIDAIIFSAYGQRSVHDKVTKKEGAFDTLVSTMRYALKRRNKKKTKIFVSTTLMRDTYRGLEAFVGEMKVLGVDAIKVEHLNFVLGSDSEASSKEGPEVQTFTLNVLHSDEEIHNMYSSVHNVAKKYPGFVFMKPHLNYTQFVTWYSGAGGSTPGCSFLKHSMFINSNGDVIPCQFYTKPIIGNVRHDSVDTIWHSDQMRQLRERACSRPMRMCFRCCKK